MVLKHPSLPFFTLYFHSQQKFPFPFPPPNIFNLQHYYYITSLFGNNKMDKIIKKEQDMEEKTAHDNKKKVRTSSNNGSPMRCCQAERCSADLNDAKQYHKRHKVCEYHAKAQVVVVAGVAQRFCQQCSRFAHHFLTIIMCMFYQTISTHKAAESLIDIVSDHVCMPGCQNGLLIGYDQLSWIISTRWSDHENIKSFCELVSRVGISIPYFSCHTVCSAWYWKKNLQTFTHIAWIHLY